uniref:C2H2-type domain-containing protein n=1 Tax=Romanomermis culicivorax TaxID=13658 RepID=A0A915L8G6_ROMCU
INVIIKYEEAHSFLKETGLHTCLDTSVDSSAAKSPLPMPPSIYDFSFHCVRCLKTFKKWHLLFEHLSEKSTLNLFACTKCWTGFLTIDALIEHLKRKHVESTDVIGQASPDNIRTDILAHVLICAHCGRHVVVADRLLARQQTNYEQFLNHATKGVYQITVHAKSQIVESILDEIESSFPSKLMITFYDTSLPVPLKCTICGSTYEKLDDVEQHFSLFHKPRSSDEEYVKACTSCGEEFWTNINYQLHQNEEHTSSKWTLIKFLKLYASNETAQDAICSRNIQLTMSKQTLRCDLCLRIMEIADFNSHDCAINYTRR